jgi:cyclophilin family peptidyl-prolyl cis-trans isomerase
MRIRAPVPYAAVRNLTILVSFLALAVAGCGGGESDRRDSAGAGQTSTSQPAAAPAVEGCRDVPPPPPREEGGQTKPKAKLDPAKTYELEVETNCGTFTIRLDPKQSPNASASLVALAKAGFFDNTTFHRIVPGFVIQGGDPTGTGAGGPGYSTRDKPPADASYTRGVVAMAKAPAEPGGAAGSQFYVVTGEDAGLPPDYAIVGKVVDGDAVVQRIGRLGDASEQPTRPVVIRTIRVKQE